MTKGRKIAEFGEGWSQEKLLAYWVRSCVFDVVGCAELLQESKLNEKDSKVVAHLLKSSERGAEQIEELFKIISEKERALKNDIVRPDQD